MSFCSSFCSIVDAEASTTKVALAFRWAQASTKKLTRIQSHHSLCTDNENETGACGVLNSQCRGQWPTEEIHQSEDGFFHIMAFLAVPECPVDQHITLPLRNQSKFIGYLGRVLVKICLKMSSPPYFF